MPRTITTARLEVTATDSGEVQQSTLSDVQPGADGRFTLDWSLTPFDTPGRTVPVTFTVTVEDELGFTTSATESGSVTVASVPPLPSPTVAPTTDPTAVAQLTREARAENLGAALILGGSAQQTNDGGIGTGTLFTLIGVIVVLVILVVLAVSRMLRLYRLAKEDALQPPTPDPTSVIDEDLAQPAIPADEMETPPEPEPIPQPDPNAGVLARLVIEQGHEHEDLEEQLTSRVFEVRDEEYIIGRSPDDAIGLTLPLPFISPQHCRLLFEDNRFYVRDMGSKNGTFVNGERVPFGQSETVPFGSEIGVSRRVILTLHAPDEELEERRLLPVEHAQGSQGSRSELEFEPLPGIQPVGDETPPPDDDYSPL